MDWKYCDQLFKYLFETFLKTFPHSFFTKMDLLSYVKDLRDRLRESGVANDSVQCIILGILAKAVTKSKSEKLKELKCQISDDLLYENLTLLSPKDAKDKISNYDGISSLSSSLRPLLGYEFTWKMKDDVDFTNFMESIKKLDLNLHRDKDVIGTIYEEFLSTGGKGKDLAQFFTDRRVIDHMVKLLDPKPLEFMCDPACGSGGFLISYLRHTNYKGTAFGFDTDSFVSSLAKINILLDSDEIGSIRNIDRRDSLINGLDRYFEIILANIPFGLSCDPERCHGSIRWGTDTKEAEIMFIRLIMVHLASGGRAGVIVPDGVLFHDDIASISTRKVLITRFNLQRIIKMKGKFFTNTGIQPSILIFSNNGSTTEVQYTELSEKGESLIARISVEIIIENNYNLLLSDLSRGDPKLDLPMVKEWTTLGKIAVTQAGKFNKSSMSELGIYPFYSAGRDNPAGKHESYCFDFPEYILIATGGGIGEKTGLGRTYLLGGKSASTNHVRAIIVRDINFLTKFIHYYLMVNLIHMKQASRGATVLRNNRVSDLIEFPIPILSLEQQKLFIDKMEHPDGIVDVGEEIISLEEDISELIESKKSLFCL